MKKYVKPLMESEAFVANDYIGACFLIDCLCINDPGNVFKDLDDTNAAMNSFNKKYNGTTYDVDDGYIFVGNVNGNASCLGANTDIHTTNNEYTDRVNEFVNWWNGTWILPLLFGRLKGIDTITNHHDITISNCLDVANYPHPNAS